LKSTDTVHNKKCLQHWTQDIITSSFTPKLKCPFNHSAAR